MNDPASAPTTDQGGLIMATLKVVCGFSGGVYSRHTSEHAAAKAAARVRRSLSNRAVCGDLTDYVQVVPIEATFSRIVPADNAFGCMDVGQARWSVWPK